MRTAGVTWTGGRAAKEPSPLTLPLQPCLPKDGGFRVKSKAYFLAPRRDRARRLWHSSRLLLRP